MSWWKRVQDWWDDGALPEGGQLGWLMEAYAWLLAEVPGSATLTTARLVLPTEKDFPVAVFSNSNVEVDYSGIGVDVVSFKPSGGYQGMSGTSMASPHVAGFIAALLSSTEYRLIDLLREKLTKRHTIDIGVEGTDTLTGLGFLTYLTKKEIAELDLPIPVVQPQPPCVIM